MAALKDGERTGMKGARGCAMRRSALAAFLTVLGCTRAEKSGQEATAQGASSAEDPAANGVVTIEVTVRTTKANGSAWDVGGGAPDIALCIGEQPNVRCYPGGESPDKIRVPQCRDAYQCSFKATAAARDFAIEVVDVDLAVNDTIGRGTCGRGRECTLGQATVRVGDRPETESAGNKPPAFPDIKPPDDGASTVAPLDAARIVELGRNPRAVPATQAERVPSGRNYSYDVGWCPHAQMSANADRADAWLISCKVTAPQPNVFGASVKLVPLFSATDPLPSGGENVSTWYEATTGALKGEFVLLSSGGEVEIMTLAFIQSERVSRIGKWLCEHRSLPGYARSSCPSF